MGFKMKGPSTHKGTLRHKLETEQRHEQIKLNRSMDQTSLPDGRPGVSPFQMATDKKTGSLLTDYYNKKVAEKSKLSLTPKKDDKIRNKRGQEIVEGENAKAKREKEEAKNKKKAKKEKERADKKAATKEHKAQMKKMKAFAKEENRKLNEKRKEQKKIDLQKKRTKKQAKAALKIDKPGTVLSRTAKKVGSKLNPWSKENKAKRAKRKAEDAANPEAALARKKARSTKIADSLEYLFMDGARPDDRAAARQAAIDKANRKKRKIKKKDNLQDTHTEQNKETKIYDHTKAKKIWDPEGADKKYTDKKMYDKRGDQYKDYDNDQYAKEAKRQQEIFNKTGKWDWRNAPK